MRQGRLQRALFGLDRAQAEEIYAALQEEKIDVKTADDGTALLVPKGSEEDIRLELSAQGLPSARVDGYDVYVENAGSFGVSDEDKERIYIYQLQQNLEQAINSMEKVKNSALLITYGSSDTDAQGEGGMGYTVSVQVELEDGANLTEEDAGTLRELISGALQVSSEDISLATV
jgi:flagellar biosynthesis/type III secretory pathway M-ring protein FliF/YscJ